MGRFISFSLFLIGTLFVSAVLSKVTVIREGEYTLDWTIKDDNITVTAVAKTLGFIGFGISPYGSMMEADLILSGRYTNGTGYIQDSYAFADTAPTKDAKQDVTLLSAMENSTHTTVSFTRKLDTGDVEDKAVLNATQFIIWSYGPTDNFQYHGPNRGTVSLNLVEA